LGSVKVEGRYRIERDALGERRVPARAYYGIQTLRATENFRVSDLPNHPFLIEAYASIKMASAMANIEVGWLEPRIGQAILKASDEIRGGALRDQFPVDRFQAGAGTSTNMNLNEVITNRALEIMGHRKGRYDIISPNDHVNMAQSTNDTFPTAMYISVHWMTLQLRVVLNDLVKAFTDKGEQFKSVLKPGRTHLQDAMPVTLGSEFTAYGESLRRLNQEMLRRSDMLLTIPLGGTATGTGINAHPEYKELAIGHLRRITGLELVPNPNSHEAMQSTTRIVAVSSSYKELAVELGRISNDLRLMSSGPTSGFGEIILPAVQPGSSIMPGKVNPVMPECLNQICFAIIGNDLAISQAAGAGQLELNVMMPVMGNLILRSAEYLVNFLPLFTEKCVTGITADEASLTRRAMNNPALATLLNVKLGYLKAAEIAKESVMTGRSVMDIALDEGLITPEESREFFAVDTIIGINKPVNNPRGRRSK
jgi:aspartate ammonia-lyase